MLLNDNSAYVQGLANSENSKSTDEVATFLLSTESSKNGLTLKPRSEPLREEWRLWVDYFRR
jgi:hypothetical protein